MTLERSGVSVAQFDSLMNVTEQIGILQIKIGYLELILIFGNGWRGFERVFEVLEQFLVAMMQELLEN